MSDEIDPLDTIRKQRERIRFLENELAEIGQELAEKAKVMEQYENALSDICQSLNRMLGRRMNIYQVQSWLNGDLMVSMKRHDMVFKSN